MEKTQESAPAPTAQEVALRGIVMLLQKFVAEQQSERMKQSWKDRKEESKAS